MYTHQPIVVDDKFPMEATNLQLFKYAAMDTLNNAEAEEAAVRLLEFSKAEGKYVGISWPDLMQRWADEYREYHAINEARSANTDAKWAFQRAMQVYHRWLIFTLGIAFFFKTKPTQQPIVPVPEDKLTKDIFSPTLMFGAGKPEHLANGFRKLIDKGLILLKSEKKDGSEDGIDYVYPTPDLVNKVMRLA